MNETLQMLEMKEIDSVRKDYPYLGEDYELLAYALAGRLAIERRDAEYYRKAYEMLRFAHEFI